jgi:hypothetical protein
VSIALHTTGPDNVGVDQSADLRIFGMAPRRFCDPVLLRVHDPDPFPSGSARNLNASKAGGETNIEPNRVSDERRRELERVAGCQGMRPFTDGGVKFNDPWPYERGPVQSPTLRAGGSFEAIGADQVRLRDGPACRRRPMLELNRPPT